MAYIVSLVEHGSFSAGRHCRISRLNRCLSRRNAIHGQYRRFVGSITVPHSGPAVLPRIVCTEFLIFNRAVLHAGQLYFNQYLHGTVLVTACSMLWDWRVLRAGQCFFVGLNCFVPFCIIHFSLSLPSFCGLALWGWSHRTGPHMYLVTIEM